MMPEKGDLVKVFGKTVFFDGKLYDDPIGILLNKWDEQLWQVLIFEEIATIHSIRLKVLYKYEL